MPTTKLSADARRFIQQLTKAKVQVSYKVLGHAMNLTDIKDRRKVMWASTLDGTLRNARGNRIFHEGTTTPEFREGFAIESGMYTLVATAEELSNPESVLAFISLCEPFKGYDVRLLSSGMLEVGCNRYSLDDWKQNYESRFETYLSRVVNNDYTDAVAMFKVAFPILKKRLKELERATKTEAQTVANLLAPKPRKRTGIRAKRSKRK